MVTLSKTNQSPLKMVVSKFRISWLPGVYFQGRLLLVSGRVTAGSPENTTNLEREKHRPKPPIFLGSSCQLLVFDGLTLGLPHLHYKMDLLLMNICEFDHIFLKGNK